MRKKTEYERRLEAVGVRDPELTPEANQALYERGIREGDDKLIHVARFRSKLIKVPLVEPPVGPEDIDYVKKSLGMD